MTYQWFNRITPKAALGLVVLVALAFAGFSGKGFGQALPKTQLVSLAQQTVTVPNPSSAYTVIILAYNHKLQPTINPWLQWLYQLQKTHARLSFYEIPVVDDKYKSYRNAIELFMKRQLPAKHFYPHVLPYYTQPAVVKAQYQAPQDNVHIWLSDASGKVMHYTTGALTPQKKAAFLLHLHD